MLCQKLMQKSTLLCAALAFAGCNQPEPQPVAQWRAVLINSEGRSIAAWHFGSLAAPEISKLDTGTTIVKADSKVILSALDRSTYRIERVGLTVDRSLVPLTIDVPQIAISNWSDPDRTPDCPNVDWMALSP